jgi:hypothetical protein
MEMDFCVVFCGLDYFSLLFPSYTRFASKRHQILKFQGEFSTQNYDNITELVKNFKYEKL